MPRMPSTLKRSPEKAQRTYAETLEHAEAEYGPGERAGRTAYASLRHSFEKVGDHWEPRAREGPSGSRQAKSGKAARGESRQALYERAKRLDIRGRSSMTREELARAVSRRER